MAKKESDIDPIEIKSPSEWAAIQKTSYVDLAVASWRCNWIDSNQSLSLEQFEAGIKSAQFSLA